VSLTAWDIETTISEHLKRKASPFTPKNWVVTHAFSNNGGPVVEYRFGPTPPPPGWLKPVLKGTRILAGFNIKFDLLHALQDPENLEAWMEYVAGGGMIWDGQLAEYLLRGCEQRAHMLSLDEVAPEYGGNIKFDEVKALWAAGVNTPDIEPALLTRYLCGEGDELGDIGNTEKIVRGQIQRARDCGQLRSILLNMGSLLCTIEMERNGMYVDKDLGLKLAAALEESLTELRAGIQQYLPKDLPFQFNWTNRYHLSPLIFGGRVKYECREYLLKDGTATWDAPGSGAHQAEEYAYSQRDEVCVEPADGVWAGLLEGKFMPMARAKAEGIPVVRYASGKNAGEPKTKKVKVDDLSKVKSRMADRFVTFPGYTTPKEEWASVTPGLYSVSSDVIEALGNRDIPFLKALSKVQSLHKDLTTYYVTYDEDGNAKGMLSLVGIDGIIHHKINHTSTVTGRFSSSDPCLQNISRGNKSDIKLVFTSRFGVNGVLIQSDFTALEIYIQALLTQCLQLIEDLKQGLDMHCLRLSNKEGMDYELVFKLCKGYTDEQGNLVDAVSEWDYKRTDAKVYSFQAAYGAGDEKISESTGIPVETVAAFRAADNARYPEIPDYFERRTAEIKANRRPSHTIPHPDVPGVMCNIGRSTVRTPDGKLYSYIEQPAPKWLVKRGVYCSFSPTEIKNYEVQGGGGEWAKAAMWLAVRAFYKHKNFGQLALLVNQVHDALYADAHNDVRLKAAALLHASMEAASDFMEYYFGWKVDVPVPSDTTWGANMKEEKKIDGIKELAQVFRNELRADYMEGFVPSFAN
jgi:DNA polymerase-1